MNRLLSAAAIVAGACVALPAAAQFQKPEDAVKYRQSAMFVMANHFGRIGAMVQGRVPYDAAQAASNAEIMATLSKLPFGGFVDGTASKGDGTRNSPAATSSPITRPWSSTIATAISASTPR